MLDLIKHNPQFRSNKFFQKSIHAQFLSRQGQYNVEPDQDLQEQFWPTEQGLPRLSYKYNRIQRQLYDPEDQNEN
jgi:hypothetical protein